MFCCQFNQIKCFILFTGNQTISCTTNNIVVTRVSGVQSSNQPVLIASKLIQSPSAIVAGSALGGLTYATANRIVVGPAGTGMEGHKQYSTILVPTGAFPGK